MLPSLRQWKEQIGHHAVWMVRDLRSPIPQYALPQGFTCRLYRDGDIDTWVSIQRDGDELLQAGRETFQKSFGDDPLSLRDRSFFVVSPDGQDVGTATAWYDEDYHGDHVGRVHWVCLRPAWQKRGLGKPLMTKVLERLARSHDRCCLATQTSRVPAIRLYLRFGFTPDIRDDEAADAWRRFQDAAPHASVAKALAQYGSNSSS
jgi:GNAT superfamily N-acetyltransferase